MMTLLYTMMWGGELTGDRWPTEAEYITGKQRQTRETEGDGGGFESGRRRI